jgi:hypothetical protein
VDNNPVTAIDKQVSVYRQNDAGEPLPMKKLKVSCKVPPVNISFTGSFSTDRTQIYLDMPRGVEGVYYPFAEIFTLINQNITAQ